MFDLNQDVVIKEKSEIVAQNEGTFVDEKLEKVDIEQLPLSKEVEEKTDSIDLQTDKHVSSELQSQNIFVIGEKSKNDVIKINQIEKSLVENEEIVEIEIDEHKDDDVLKNKMKPRRLKTRFEPISSDCVKRKPLLLADDGSVIQDSNEETIQKGEEKSDLPVESQERSKTFQNVSQKSGKKNDKSGKKQNKKSEKKEKSDFIFEKAQIVQLKKPADEFGKVFECFVEFLTGNFAGKRILIRNKDFPEFPDANLIYNIWPGEPCIVRYRIVYRGLEIYSVRLKTKFHETPEEQSERVTNWIRARGLTNQDFFKWTQVSICLIFSDIAVYKERLDYKEKRDRPL